MKGTDPEPSAWSPLRWWGTIVFVTAAQAGVILWLSERKLIVPRRPDVSSAFQLFPGPPPDSGMAEWLNIDDPTVLARPDSRGFSGPAWMIAPTLRHESRDWTEPHRWLNLPVAGLGASFAEFVRTNFVGPLSLADKPAPRLSEVAFSPVPLPMQSTFRIEGALARRELLTPLEVPSVPHSDILTNTVVRLEVGAAGFTFSSVVLSSSGSKAADRFALDLARSARFKPVPRAGPASPGNPVHLTAGEIIFQWHTLEMPSTNGPAAKPPP